MFSTPSVLGFLEVRGGGEEGSIGGIGTQGVCHSAQSKRGWELKDGRKGRVGKNLKTPRELLEPQTGGRVKRAKKRIR